MLEKELEAARALAEFGDLLTYVGSVVRSSNDAVRSTGSEVDSGEDWADHEALLGWLGEVQDAARQVRNDLDRFGIGAEYFSTAGTEQAESGAVGEAQGHCGLSASTATFGEGKDFGTFGEVWNR